MKFLRIFKYSYLIFALLFAYEVIANWNINKSRAYLSLFFVIFAVFIFLFRYKYQRRFKDRDN